MKAIAAKNKKLGDKGQLIPSMIRPIKTTAMTKLNARENQVAKVSCSSPSPYTDLSFIFFEFLII